MWLLMACVRLGKLIVVMLSLDGELNSPLDVLSLSHRFPGNFNRQPLARTNT
jgi:hypothetical protein